MSEAVPSGVRDQLQHFITTRCRSHALEINDLPKSLAALLENEPTRTTTFILAMRTTPDIGAMTPGTPVTTDRELLVANLFSYALEHFAPPVCIAELVSFAERHTGVGSPPEFRRLRSIVGIHFAASFSDSKMPGFGAGLQDPAAVAAANNNRSDPDALHQDNSASYSSGQANNSDGGGGGGGGCAVMSLSANSSLLAPLGCDSSIGGSGAGGAGGGVAGGGSSSGIAGALSSVNPGSSSASAAASVDLGGRRRAVVATPLAPVEDNRACALKRNADVAGVYRYTLRSRIVKPYLEQQRLRLTRDQISNEFGVLAGTTPLPAASSGQQHVVSSSLAPVAPSAAGMLSSAVATLVKLSLDSYVAKLPLNSAEKLREASESLLHLLTTLLVRSHGFAVKQRAFDVLLNLAVHAQLIECSNEFRTRPTWMLLSAGATPAVSASAAPSRQVILSEIEWVLARVLEHLPLVVSSPVTQIQVDASAARLLVAALKVVLLIVPAPRMAQVVPPAALSLFMQLLVVRQCTVAVFDSLSNAVCEAVLGQKFDDLVRSAGNSSAGADEISPASAPPPPPPSNCLRDYSATALDQFGGVQAVVDHLVAAPTSRSAACLFSILYCIHNLNVQQQLSAGASPSLPAVDMKPLRAALRIGLHWHCRFLLINGEGVRAVPQLKRLIAQDLQRDPSLHRPLTSFMSELIAGSAAAHSNALCASHLIFSISSSASSSSSSSSVQQQQHHHQQQQHQDQHRFKLFSPDMPAVCRELSDPRSLAALLDESDSVVADTTSRLCAHALLYEWSCAAAAGTPAVAQHLLLNTPQQPSPGTSSSSLLPAPTVTSSLLAVSRVPSARSRAALLHMLRCVVVVLRARVPAIAEQIAAAASTAAASDGGVSASGGGGGSMDASTSVSAGAGENNNNSSNILNKTAPSSPAVVSAQCTAYIRRRFAALVQQLLDVSCNAGPSASLPFVCGLTRIVLESCMQQIHSQLEKDAVSSAPTSAEPSSSTGLVLPDDVVTLTFHKKVLSTTPQVVESIGGVSTLWRLYKALRVVDEHSSTLLNQPCCRLRLAVLRVTVSVAETHVFDVADVNNWRIALADQCSQCSSVAASYVVRAVSQPFDDENEAAASGRTTTTLFDSANKLLSAIMVTQS